MAEDRLEQVKSLIGSYPDFPKPGILFRDIFPVLRNPKVFGHMIDLLCEQMNTYAPSAEVIVGLESRGFIFGPLIAQKLGLSFVPIRKAGKLPGKCCKASFTLEYGTDSFEAQADSIKRGQNVVIVDDLLATGGSLKASVELMDTIGANVLLCLVVMELKDLNGRSKINKSFHSLIEF